MEAAANHAQEAWQMLEVWIRQQNLNDRDEDGFDVIESPNLLSSIKVRVQLNETLAKVNVVTQKLLMYFDEVRDGNEAARRKALGEDAQLFVKVSA